MMMRRGLTIATLALLGSYGCADEVPEEAPLAAGKADSAGKICSAHGLERDCDPCEPMGWYQDATCDPFCQAVDSVCEDMVMIV